MNSGRSLELYFVDGNPDGMLSAEVFNWTGHVLRVPRTRLADGLKRTAAKQTGVYILIGEDDEGPLAYIGEAENMADRLRQHASPKDWWDSAVMVTTAGDALHKAHVKYLESRLVEIAIDASTTRLENGNIPPKASLNEAATANMESFLETLNMVLPAIGLETFQDKRRIEPEKLGTSSSTLALELRAPKRAITARATISNGEVVVLSGSQIIKEWVGKRIYHVNLQKKHAELLGSEIVEIKEGHGVFVQNYAFSSLSAAAAVILGRSANGRLEWRLQNTGQTYAEWEDQQLSEAVE